MTAAAAPAQASLDARAEEFLAWLAVERGRSPRTVEAYRRDLVRYQGHLAGSGPRGRADRRANPAHTGEAVARAARERSEQERETPPRGARTSHLSPHALSLDHVSEADVAAFVRGLQRGGLAPASVTRALVSVRGLHRFLVAEGHRADDPSADVEIPSLPRGLPKALSAEQVVSLMEAVMGDDPPARRDRAVLELLYGTGCRISEAGSLSLPDVDLHDGLVRVTGKGAKERIVPLGRCAAEALARWLSPEGRGKLEPDRWARRGDAEAVFLNRRGGRLSRQGLWLTVRRHADTAGLGSQLTPHVLRHSCATHMLDGGADIRIVQEMLGHASVSTTQIYTRVSTERLRAVYRAAHPRATA